MRQNLSILNNSNYQTQSQPTTLATSLQLISIHRKACSTVHRNFPAENANDGDINTFFHTNDTYGHELGGWLRVDLESNYCIQSHKQKSSTVYTYKNIIYQSIDMNHMQPSTYGQTCLLRTCFSLPYLSGPVSSIGLRGVETLYQCPP